MEKSDSDIIGSIIKGNKDDYKEIVERYRTLAYSVALGYVANAEDALDISQEAFIKAYRKLKNFDRKRPFLPWFYKIVKNVCLNFLKKREIEYTNIIEYTKKNS